MSPTLIAAIESTIDRLHADADDITRKAKRKGRNERMHAIFDGGKLRNQAQDLRRELDQYLAAGQDVGAAA